jgi:hypothetical protein
VGIVAQAQGAGLVGEFVARQNAELGKAPHGVPGGAWRGSCAPVR